MQLRLFILFATLTIFFSNSFAEIKDADEKTMIKSNSLIKENEDVIKAIGDVEIKKGNKLFNANEVEYNQSTKIIKANSKVKVYDEKKEQIFFSRSAEINNDFTDGYLNDGVILFRNGSNIKSPYIRKLREFELRLKNANYSVCPTSIYNKNLTYEEMMEELEKQKTPFFSLKSSIVKANTDENYLKLWGTSVWFWKIPIFYLPYLKTSLAFEENTDGFEIPGIENTTHYGYGIYMPYNITTKNQKVRITPKVYQKGNYLLNLKYNLKSNDTEKWKINFEGDITNDNGYSKNLKNAYNISEFEEGKYKKWRGFAKLDGYYDFNKLWSFDFNSGIISDRYYLRDYRQDSLLYFQSNFKFTRVNMENIEDFNYFQFSNLFFQELLERNPRYVTPRYAPVTNTNLQNTIFRNDVNNIFYNIKLNTTNIFRKTGVEYNRISLTPIMSNALNTKFGTINADIELQSDLYIMNEVSNISYRKYNDTESRMMPQLNLEWRKSFISKHILFQPIIKYSGSPNSKAFENKIPNEDSMPYGINFENIFSNNRFIGYDRREFGNRLTYGFESILFNNFSIGIAQGYRDNVKNDTYKLLWFEDNVSDYVGYLSYIFNDIFDVYYRFVMDKEKFNFKKNEINLNLNINNFGLYATYIEIKPNYLYPTLQNQATFGGYVVLFKKWNLSTSTTLDLKNGNRFLESRAGIIYDGGCTRWELYYQNSNPLTQTSRNSSINFNFAIKFI